MSSDVVVTSFSKAGAEQYGYRCVDSFARYWSGRVRLVAYVDEPLDLSYGDMRLTSEIPGWTETKAQLPRFNASADKPSNYIWDAQRFAVKAFVWADAAERMQSGRLTWIDGDTITTQNVPDDLPTRLVGDADVAYLGRGTMHPENGYVGFRLPGALPVIRWCRDAYVSGSFRSIDSGWTDCHVLRAAMQACDVSARDLTSHRHAGPWRSVIDAMSLSPLGPYVTHLKGPRRKREAA